MTGRLIAAAEINRFLRHAKIRYVEQQHAGVAARNTGIASAPGSLIALFDQDDLWLTNKLERQVAFLNSPPNGGLVHLRVECDDQGAAPVGLPLRGILRPTAVIR